MFNQESNGIPPFSAMTGKLVNPRPPSDAARKQNYFTGSLQFSIITIQKISPPRNLKFCYLGIFQSLKLRISMGKNPFNFSQAKFHSDYFGLGLIFFVRT